MHLFAFMPYCYCTVPCYATLCHVLHSTVPYEPALLCPAQKQHSTAQHSTAGGDGPQQQLLAVLGDLPTRYGSTLLALLLAVGLQKQPEASDKGSSA
jgi:hypothetical protein